MYFQCVWMVKFNRDMSRLQPSSLISQFLLHDTVTDVIIWSGQINSSWIFDLGRKQAVHRYLLMWFQFVAHPNCQQHLTSMWYGTEMGFLQSMALWKLALMWLVCVPFIPVFCVIYLFAPDTKVGLLLLTSITKVKKVKTIRALGRAHVPPTKVIRRLSE